MTYSEWIAINVPGDGRNRCEGATLLMAAAFPELRRVRGHYRDPNGWLYAHWWMVAPDGAVVDPTAAQFLAGGTYEPLDESQPHPTGKCINCGFYAYDDKDFCSGDCAIEYWRWFERETGVMRRR
jgi:hypothetical protein